MEVISRVEKGDQEARQHLADLREIAEGDSIKFRELFSTRFRKPILWE